VWSQAQFTVDFMRIGVGQKLIQQAAGAFQFQDAIGGQERGQALLPVVVAALDFAFGLRRGSAGRPHRSGAPRRVE
jgi:hypothetical protein